MTIQQKLLEYYKKCLSELPDRMHKITKYLIHNHIELGVCYCARYAFNEDITMEDWVLDNIKLACYWGPVPVTANRVEGVKERLQLRIDILSKIVNENKD